MSNRYAVILCGGSGTRLWPLSRSLRPKQLLCLNGEESLLQQTIRRLLNKIPPSHIVTVTHEDHKFEVKGQLAEISTELIHGVLAEPVARNTLPAIAWASAEIYRRDPNAIISVFPSDHAISDEAQFLKAWTLAESVAEYQYLTLIGVVPTEPATGFGYIQPLRALAEVEHGDVFSVARFVEKPVYEIALDYVKQGYLWNGGMFIFQVDIFRKLLESLQPEIFRIVSESTERILENYPEFPNISMDYGLVEKADKVAVVRADMGWSDLGSWDSIYQRHPKDAEDNILKGNVLAKESSGSVFWSTHGLLACLGVKDSVVIQTADATLVCDRNRTEDIKQLVTEIQSTQPHLTESHLTVHRPWGTYTVLEEGTNFKIKRIVVDPGASLSMQLHEHRSEHWVVVSGKAKIINGNNEIFLEQNESTYIPKSNKHRLTNPGTEPLHMIEVQCGDYVGEDDIIRFDDHYGRT